MIIGILQPGYLPWLGFFDQIFHTDKFVILDDVQYTTRDWRSRNRIKTPNGVIWLTVPTHGTQHDIINQVKIDYGNNWQKKHLKSIEFSYKKAPSFNWLMPDLKKIINRKFTFLLDLDIELIYCIMKKIGIQTEILFSSSLKIVERDKSLRMLRIVEKLGGNHLLEGKAGLNYIDINIFTEKGIKVEFQDYKHPVYPQLWGEFIPYLSVIDLLFSCGNDSLKYIVGEKERKK